MPPPIPVFLASYSSAWPKRAADHAACLRTLGSTLIAVHHIGSTSVPRLAAKPIIDLMALVTGLDELDGKRSLVEALGWRWHGELGISGRRYCALSDEGGVRIAQLHIFAADSPQVVRHLAFRDYLRAHREVARAYEQEKRRARDLHPNDSHAYTDEKDAWIRRTEADALAWFAEQRSDKQNPRLPEPVPSPARVARASQNSSVFQRAGDFALLSKAVLRQLLGMLRNPSLLSGPVQKGREADQSAPDIRDMDDIDIV